MKYGILEFARVFPETIVPEHSYYQFSLVNAQRLQKILYVIGVTYVFFQHM